MRYTEQQLDELNILVRYNLTTMLEGIKIHKDADVHVIEAAQRLYKKGLLSQTDGGYLTNLGREAAEHAQTLFDILKDE